MTQSEELEIYNKEFNERIIKNKVKDLIHCTRCKGTGIEFFYPTDSTIYKCWKCKGEKYIPRLEYGILSECEKQSLFKPIRDLPQHEINFLNEVNK